MKKMADEITIEEIKQLDNSLAIREEIQEEADMDALIASVKDIKEPEKLHNTQKEKGLKM